jgi:hypothetical protein
MATKKKLTLSINKSTLDQAKAVAEAKHISLSGAVENFLDFFANPYVYCFKCGKKFDSDKAELCAKCGWLTCPHCGICRCGLNEDEAASVFHMRRVYEDLLSGRVK